MPRKPKFRPVITRIKLNPEQAVLSCNCYGWGHQTAVAGSGVPLNGFSHNNGAIWGCVFPSGAGRLINSTRTTVGSS